MKLPPFPKPQVDYQALLAEARREPSWAPACRKWVVRPLVALVAAQTLYVVVRHLPIHHLALPMFSMFTTRF